MHTTQYRDSKHYRMHHILRCPWSSLGYRCKKKIESPNFWTSFSIEVKRDLGKTINGCTAYITKDTNGYPDVDGIYDTGLHGFPSFSLTTMFIFSAFSRTKHEP